MKNNKIRSAIIAVVVLLMVGFGLFSLELEPADVPVGGDTQQEQQSDAVVGSQDDAVQDAVDEPAQQPVEEPAAGDDIGNDDAADEQTADDNKPVADEQTADDNKPVADDKNTDDKDAASQPVDQPADAADPQPAADPVQDPEPAVSGTVTGGDGQALTCTFEIRCDTVVDTSKLEDQSAAPYVPADGVILAATEVEFTQGETVFDVLKRVTRANDIQMEFEEDNLYGGAYIEGINYLYEFAGGKLSGWMFKVNGQFPSYGCASCELQDGDAVVWVYTCDLGADVGDNSMWQ